MLMRFGKSLQLFYLLSRRIKSNSGCKKVKVLRIFTEIILLAYCLTDHVYYLRLIGILTFELSGRFH